MGGLGGGGSGKPMGAGQANKSNSKVSFKGGKAVPTRMEDIRCQGPASSCNAGFCGPVWVSPSGRGGAGQGQLIVPRAGP